MYAFLQEYHLIASKQFDFRAKLSTNVALAQFTEQILDNLDKKLIAGAVLIDLREAFDTVDHALLMSKLKRLGFSIVSHRIVSHCVVLCCIVLYRIVLYCTILLPYCT